jgi:hypothetical protein
VFVQVGTASEIEKDTFVIIVLMAQRNSLIAKQSNAKKANHLNQAN